MGQWADRKLTPGSGNRTKHAMVARPTLNLTTMDANMIRLKRTRQASRPLSRNHKKCMTFFNKGYHVTTKRKVMKNLRHLVGQCLNGFPVKVHVGFRSFFAKAEHILSELFCSKFSYKKKRQRILGFTSTESNFH